MKIKKIIKKIEMDEIDSISYSFCWETGENRTQRFTNNCGNIIFESFINEKLEELKEIDQEGWSMWLNNLIVILNKKNYSWNNHYLVGISILKNKNPWKIEIVNKNGEYIEIKNRNKNANQFDYILEYFSSVYFEKWNSYRKINF
jgi:hypothetical protein